MPRIILINNEFYLVDLPGHDYAKVSKKELAAWIKRILMTSPKIKTCELWLKSHSITGLNYYLCQLRTGHTHFFLKCIDCIKKYTTVLFTFSCLPPSEGESDLHLFLSWRYKKQYKGTAWRNNIHTLKIMLC